MRARRVLAVVRRHWYPMVRSAPRVVENFFWPIVDLLLWGSLVLYLEREDARLPIPIAFLLGGLLLWDLVFRAKNAVSITFIDEAYHRNVVSVLASPISPTEYLVGAVLWALAKAGLSWAILTVLAATLFSFNLLTVGPEVAAYLGLVLVFGIALSLFVLGLVLRFGHAADELPWAMAAIFIPFCAVFYPVAALPGWARGVAAVVPPAHVFEAMRSALAGRAQAWGSLWTAGALDLAYLLGGLVFARAMFGLFRRRGYITRYM
jgi:ABC-2 type transport system permease protein